MTGWLLKKLIGILFRWDDTYISETDLAAVVKEVEG